MSLFCCCAQMVYRCHYESLRRNLSNTLVGLGHGLKGLTSWDLIHVSLTFHWEPISPWRSCSYLCRASGSLGLQRMTGGWQDPVWFWKQSLQSVWTHQYSPLHLLSSQSHQRRTDNTICRKTSWELFCVIKIHPLIITSQNICRWQCDAAGAAGGTWAWCWRMDQSTHPVVSFLQKVFQLFGIFTSQHHETLLAEDMEPFVSWLFNSIQFICIAHNVKS